MKRTVGELRAYLLSLVNDVEFTWRGVHGLIIPFSRDRYILSFHDPDDQGTEFHSVDDLLTAPYLDGNSFSDVCDQIDFLT